MRQLTVNLLAAIAVATVLFGPALDGTAIRIAGIFWVVRNRVKMTAMPARQKIISEEETWSVATFEG